MSLLWSTRGRAWGYRFLARGGHDDPLPVYEAAFDGTDPDGEFLIRRGDVAVLRMRDPQGRRDRSGREIIHDFLLDGEEAAMVTDLETARQIVWSMVGTTYDALWDAHDPLQSQPALGARGARRGES